MIDGAFVDGHPSHRLINDKKRDLSDYLGKKDRSSWEYYNDGREEWVIKTTKCIKFNSFKNI
jgi:hypothetical protein